MPAWVRLELDLSTFDPAPFQPYLDRAARAGLTFTTLADLGDTPDQRRRLYELNKTCAADIPERGEFFSYDEYVEQRYSPAGFRPAGVILALHGDEWAGFSMTSVQPGYAFSEMTGILRSYRGRGLSIAVKLHAIAFAQGTGLPVLRTFHHPLNTSAITMNRRLGFVTSEPSPGS